MFKLKKIAKPTASTAAPKVLKVRRIDPNKQPLEKDMTPVEFDPTKVGLPKPKPKLDGGLRIGLPLVSQIEPEYHARIMHDFKLRELRRMNPPTPKQQPKRKKVVVKKSMDQLKGFFGVSK